MKPLLFIALFLLSFAKVTGQFNDTYQPAAVYKQNNVKARVLMFDRARVKKRIMTDFFDHKGNLTEHIEYDTLGEKIVIRELLTYDSAGKISRQRILFYTFYDTAQKKTIFSTVPDTAIVTVVYDSFNRRSTQTYYGGRRKEFTEVIYHYDPFTKLIKKVCSDSSVEETVFYYDKPNIENKMVYTHAKKDGTSITEILTYKNSFDKLGRIAKRRVKDESPVEHSGTYFRDIEYSYMNNGLLIKRFSSNLSDGSDWLMGLLFDYKFWE